MKESLFDRLDADFERYPILRASEGASVAEVEELFRSFGRCADDGYSAFLLKYGAAMVGAWPIYGLRPAEVLGTAWNVEALTQSYRDDNWPGVEEWIIISNDLAGNPAGLTTDGSIWLSDHDFGQIVKIADSFLEFLAEHCLKPRGHFNGA